MKKLLFLLFLSLPVFSPAAEVVYQAPAGNSASVAAPRDDWFVRVQEKFTKYGGKPADIVFDGDSITNRWERAGKETWAARFAGRAADFGIEGDRTENLLWRLQKGQVDGIDPKLVVVMIGTNNIRHGDAPEQVAEGIKAIVAAYKDRCPRAHLVLMAVFPRAQSPGDPERQKVAEINAIIKSLDDGNRVSYVDIGPKLLQPDGTLAAEMAPDFLHPAAQGYVIWANAIEPFVDKYAPRNP